jgi:hypothetical protein
MVEKDPRKNLTFHIYSRGRGTNQERWISKCNLVLQVLNAILINANSVEGYVVWILGTSTTQNVHGQWSSGSALQQRAA